MIDNGEYTGVDPILRKKENKMNKKNKIQVNINDKRSGQIIVDKKAQFENNIYYLQRRLREWKIAFWFMAAVAFGIAVVWGVK